MGGREGRACCGGSMKISGVEYDGWSWGTPARVYVRGSHGPEGYSWKKQRNDGLFDLRGCRRGDKVVISDGGASFGDEQPRGAKKTERFENLVYTNNDNINPKKGQSMTMPTSPCTCQVNPAAKVITCSERYVITLRWRIAQPRPTREARKVGTRPPQREVYAT